MEVLAEPLTTTPTVERPAWKALDAHYKKVRKLHLRKLFADDATRGDAGFNLFYDADLVLRDE